MIHSDCTGNPYTCSYSSFFEQVDKESLAIRRWVECCEEYIDEDGYMEMRETGILCEANPANWWEEYKSRK